MKNHSEEEIRHMNADQLVNKYYNKDNWDLKVASYNIFMSASMDIEKAFFMMLKKAVQDAESDEKINELLEKFYTTFEETRRKYSNIQDGKQERILFAHGVGYLVLGDQYLRDEGLSDQHIEELHYFIENGQIRDRIETHNVHYRHKIADILTKKFFEDGSEGHSTESN